MAPSAGGIVAFYRNIIIQPRGFATISRERAPMHKLSDYYIESVLLFVAFLWGIHPAVVKIGLPYVPPVPYNALRLDIALAVAWPAVAASGRYRPIERQDVKPFLLISLAGFFVFQLFFTVGVQNTTAGNASLILSLIPVSVAIINRIFGLEHISRQVTLGIIASLVGIFLIVLGSGKEISLAGPHLLGALMLLAAQAGYGYYTVFSKDLLAKYSPYQVTAVVTTVSAVLFTIISLPELLAMTLTALPAKAWLSMTYSGAIGLCLGNYLFLWGIAKVGSAHAAVYNNFCPVFAVIAGYFMLGEEFGLLQFAGAAIIFWGLYQARRKPSA